MSFSFAASAPRVMGILNVTPDSFSDGGRFNTPETAVARAREMVRDGVDLIDIGAQSTRPGSPRLSADEEWARLAPCLTAVAAAVDCPLSVDTYQPSVAAAALQAGAAVINDVSGGLQNDMVTLSATHGAGLIAMRPGEPSERTVPAAQVLADTAAFFEKATAAARAAGLPLSDLCLDVGFGFGSSSEGDVALVAHLPALISHADGAAVMVAASRKRTVCEVCGTNFREAGTLAIHTAALLSGAGWVRAHDTAAAVASARVVAALQQSRKETAFYG